MSQIQQIQLTLPVVNPETGFITEYGRQVLSDFLIAQTNQNTADISDGGQLNSAATIPQSERQLDINFGVVGAPFPQQITDPADLAELFYSLHQEVLSLRQRVEDLENGS